MGTEWSISVSVIGLAIEGVLRSWYAGMSLCMTRIKSYHSTGVGTGVKLVDTGTIDAAQDLTSLGVTC
jgi:hypothetical protein